METEVVEVTDTYSVHRCTDTGVLLFTWESYVTGSEFREALRDWQAYIEQDGVRRYIVNTENVTAHTDEDKTWLAETWIPDLIETGVRRGAGVYRDSAIAQMDMARIEDSLSSIHPAYEFRVFASEMAAENWLLNGA